MNFGQAVNMFLNVITVACSTFMQAKLLNVFYDTKRHVIMMMNEVKIGMSVRHTLSSYEHRLDFV